MARKTTQQIVSLLKQISKRLDSMAEKPEPDTEPDDLSAYPAQYLSIKEALPYLPVNSRGGVYNAISKGEYLLGTELLDTQEGVSPQPRYQINVRAYYRRLRKEQTPSK